MDNVKLYFSFRPQNTTYEGNILKRIINPYFRKGEISDNEFDELCNKIESSGKYRIYFDSLYDESDKPVLKINIIGDKYKEGEIYFTVISDVATLADTLNELY